MQKITYFITSREEFLLVRNGKPWPFIGEVSLKTEADPKDTHS